MPEQLDECYFREKMYEILCEVSEIGVVQQLITISFLGNSIIIM